eukprot:Gb_32656 [translate_table: standard]
MTFCLSNIDDQPGLRFHIHVIQFYQSDSTKKHQNPAKVMKEGLEKDADVSLQEFGDLLPPFPCWNELLYDVPGSATVTNSPILLIQVTRLTCGGFIFALPGPLGTDTRPDTRPTGEERQGSNTPPCSASSFDRTADSSLDATARSIKGLSR